MTAPRVGSLVYCTDQGLGYLAKNLYDAGVLSDVLVVHHGRREEHLDWFPGAGRLGDPHAPQTKARVREWLATLDAFLALETPFVWETFDWCRDLGVTSFLMPMHECTPDPLPAQPDFFLCPSLIDWRCYPNRSFFLPVPVEDGVRARWRRRGPVHTFVHNAGHGGLKGRNGTGVVLEAWNYVRSPARLVVRSQDPLPGCVASRREVFCPGDGRDGQTKEYVIGNTPREHLYDDGEAFLFPEGFNGLSLPLQEAYASGMVVMCGDRVPMNAWLPRGPLLPVAGYRRERVGPAYREYDRAEFDPRAVAAHVDEWYGRDAGPYSDLGRQWAADNSWDVLRPRYLGVLSQRPPGRG